MEIRLKNVSKYYKDGEKSIKGVEDVSLSFNTNSSFVVITGESGSGKSTLIKILTGIEDFDEGEIYFDDVILSQLSNEERKEIYSDNVSFVFQDYNLVESFSALENIVIALIKKAIQLRKVKKELMMS